MEAKVIQIGNSKGIRLSKTILKQYEIHEKVEIILEKDHIVIRPIDKPRAGWAEQFAQMAKDGEDELLMPDVFSEEEIEEWS